MQPIMPHVAIHRQTFTRPSPQWASASLSCEIHQSESPAGLIPMLSSSHMCMHPEQRLGHLPKCAITSGNCQDLKGNQLNAQTLNCAARPHRYASC